MSLNRYINNLSKQEVGHLLRRATYVCSPSLIDRYEGMRVEDILDDLFDTSGFSLPYLPFDPNTGRVWVYDNSTFADYLAVSYYQFYNFLLKLEETHVAPKLREFLFNFMALSSHDRKPQHCFHAFNLLNWGISNSIPEFCKKVFMDSLYLDTLNNAQNTDQSPIEDAGRELLEMLLLGDGEQVAPGDYTTYTEDDVRALSRVMTGLKPAYVYDGTPAFTDPDTGIPRGIVVISQHDTSDKTFSHRFNNLTVGGGTDSSGVLREIGTVVDHIFSRREAAFYYISRLYRFFVADTWTPVIEQTIIEPLVDDFINNGFHLVPVLRRLLESEHFFDGNCIGSKVKSGQEYLASVMNGFDVNMPDRSSKPNDFWHLLGRDVIVRFILQNYGHEPAQVPSIAGYPANWVENKWSHTWIVPRTLSMRQKLTDMIEDDTLFIDAWRKSHMSWEPHHMLTYISQPDDPFVVVDELLNYFYPKQVSVGRLFYFLDDVFLEGKQQSYWKQEYDLYINGGNDNVVRAQMLKLVRAIIQAPEFQQN